MQLTGLKSWTLRPVTKQAFLRPSSILPVCWLEKAQHQVPRAHGQINELGSHSQGLQTNGHPSIHHIFEVDWRYVKQSVRLCWARNQDQHADDWHTKPLFPYSLSNAATWRNITKLRLSQGLALAHSSWRKPHCEDPTPELTTSFILFWLPCISAAHLAFGGCNLNRGCQANLTWN